MEQAENKKKKAIISISVVAAIVLVLIISLCIAFAPKKIERILPLDNIEKIEVSYLYFENEDSAFPIEGVKELDAEEKEYLLNTLKKTSYKPIYDEILTQGPIIFYIYYTNGDLAELQQYRMSITDKDGNTKIYKTIELDFDYDAFKDVVSSK